MIDRILAPLLSKTVHLPLLPPHTFDITSDVKLYFIKDVPNETARLELFFDAGNKIENFGIPAFTNCMLFSGTNSKSSTQIHEEIDSLGGYLDNAVSIEDAHIDLYALRENLLPLAHILKDSIENASFPENEYTELMEDKKQNFLIGMEKMSSLAQRNFQERLFHSHPEYAKIPQEDWYITDKLNEIKSFHKKHYLQGLTKIVVVGNIEQDVIDEIIDLFGNWCAAEILPFGTDFKNLTDKIHIEKDAALQTAIRIGRILFNKTHPDFLDFAILQTILGDYFGSRLMKNIREDKGYTYGIGSLMAEYHEAGYFVIVTEVAKEFKDATLTEIKKEFEILQNELVSEDELSLVQNYLLGQLLKSADGPYQMMDLFLNVEQQKMDLTYYDKVIEGIQNITPQRLQELAKKYLNWEDYTIVSVG